MLKKIAILLSGSISLFVFWIWGLEKVYAQILNFGATMILSPFKNVTPVLKMEQAHPDFCVAVGKQGYCMQLELFGLSIIVMLSWYILMIALDHSKKMIFIAIKHIFIFYLLQIITMSTLALYSYGSFFQQANDALRQSFIIIAMVFIIWDNYLHGVFKFKSEPE